MRVQRWLATWCGHGLDSKTDGFSRVSEFPCAYASQANPPGPSWSHCPLMSEARHKPMGRITARSQNLFWRFASDCGLPAHWFVQGPPAASERAAKTGELTLEIVTHCWQYSHLLSFQLSSLLHFPPTKLRVIFTVFYAREDEGTQALLDHFEGLNLERVQWNWCDLPRAELFRRSIGRNRAALESRADWIWFADCDLVFHESCLDVLAEALQGRTDALLFPGEEHCSPLLDSDDPLLTRAQGGAPEPSIPTERFTASHRTKATGAYQIVHGDVARAVGYCRDLSVYQQPSEAWMKTREDSAFRWIIGTDGIPIDVPGVYRIRHIAKGRYTGSTVSTGVRSWTRRVVSWLSELRSR